MLWRLPTRLFLGTVPRSPEHLAELHEQGVRAVVTLNQRWEPQVVGGVPKAAAVAQLVESDAMVVPLGCSTPWASGSAVFLEPQLSSLVSCG